MKIPSHDQKIIDYKLIHAQALGGSADNYEFDGVLGLGKEYDNSNEDISEYQSAAESDVGLMSQLVDTDNSINIKTFTIDVSENKISIGKNITSNIVQWIPISDEVFDTDYFKWRFTVLNLHVLDTNNKKEDQNWDVQPFIVQNRGQRNAEFSLSTSKIILTSEYIDKIIDYLKQKHKIECTSDESTKYYVVCDDIGSKEKKLFSKISLQINLASSDQFSTPIFMNPENWINKCKKNKCILNISKSRTSQIFLGEALFKENKLVFDLENSMVGVEPHKQGFFHKVYRKSKVEIKKKTKKIKKITSTAAKDAINLQKTLKKDFDAVLKLVLILLFGVICVLLVVYKSRSIKTIDKLAQSKVFQPSQNTGMKGYKGYVSADETEIVQAEQFIEEN